MTKKEERMRKLNEAGMNNGYSLRIDNIPYGKTITIMVDGTEMSIEDFNLMMKKDDFSNKIMESGYVRNSKIHRRWITAQTFKMLNYYNGHTGSQGWDGYLKDYIPYDYMFKQTLEEIRVLSILEKEDKEAFEERVRYFNKNVVIKMLKHYRKQLDKYIIKLNSEKREYDNIGGYITLKKYRKVYLYSYSNKDVLCRYDIFNTIDIYDDALKYADKYTDIYSLFESFMENVYNPLPFDTPKCPAWRDAYKGAGAYYTLQNIAMYHNVRLFKELPSGDEMLLKAGVPSVKYLSEITKEYEGEGWRLHEYMKEVININNFDLATSIQKKKAEKK